MTTSLQQFFAAYEREISERPGLRRGQAAFNALYLVNPRLAGEVNGSAHDPFYDDNRLPSFFAYLQSVWAEVSA